MQSNIVLFAVFRKDPSMPCALSYDDDNDYYRKFHHTIYRYHERILTETQTIILKSKRYKYYCINIIAEGN